MRISFIIPCYNEGKRLRASLNKLIYYALKKDSQIVLVDDGSTDNTFQIMQDFWARYPKHILVVSSSENFGKGFAVRTGLSLKKYEVALILDADLSVCPSELDTIKHIGNRHFIIKGERNQVEPQPFYRIFLGKCWQVLVWLRTGIFMDTQCPFTMLYLPKDLIDDLKINGFAFDVEILYKAKKKHIAIIEKPVNYYNDPDSKVTFKKTAQMFWDLLRIRK